MTLDVGARLHLNTRITLRGHIMFNSIAWALGGLFASAAMFAAPSAAARDKVEWSINVGGSGYYPPPPAYAPPPSIMYPPPPRVYVQPVPVYPYGPVVRYGQPYYGDPYPYAYPYGYQDRHWRERQHWERRHREEQWREHRHHDRHRH